MKLFFEVLKQESKSIEECIEYIDSGTVVSIVSAIADCKLNDKKLVVTGVGKSGIIARKVSATFLSIGVTSVFLNPTDALHGDLGVVSKEDLVMVFSNSGETSEIICLLPHLQSRGAQIIAIVGKKDSTIARQSNFVIPAVVSREACPLNLAPTSSTAVSMSIGDALAVCFMELQGLNESDFALNHPSGALGKQLTLQVSDLMRPISEFHLVRPEDNLPCILDAITQDQVGAACVLSDDEKSLVGLITDGDLRRNLRSHQSHEWPSLTAKDIMTRDPVRINQDQHISEAILIMEKQRESPISALVVYNQSCLVVGIIHIHDIINSGLT